MNAVVKTALTATGSDQAVTVTRECQLVIRCKTAEVEVRNADSAADLFPIPANTPFVIGASGGQTLYLRSTAGATIYLLET